MLGNEESKICACGAVDETLTYLWWECIKWNPVREKHGCDELPYTRSWHYDDQRLPADVDLHPEDDGRNLQGTRQTTWITLKGLK